MSKLKFPNGHALSCEEMLPVALPKPLLFKKASLKEAVLTYQQSLVEQAEAKTAYKAAEEQFLPQYSVKLTSGRDAYKQKVLALNEEIQQKKNPKA